MPQMSVSLEQEEWRIVESLLADSYDGLHAEKGDVHGRVSRGFVLNKIAKAIANDASIRPTLKERAFEGGQSAPVEGTRTGGNVSSGLPDAAKADVNVHPEGKLHEYAPGATGNEVPKVDTPAGHSGAPTGVKPPTPAAPAATPPKK